MQRTLERDAINAYTLSKRVRQFMQILPMEIIGKKQETQCTRGIGHLNIREDRWHRPTS